MKKGTGPYRNILLAILMGLSSGLLDAQSPFDADRREEAMQIHEQILMFTDRSLYAVDERIQFVAKHRVSGSTGENQWSSVLYVELLASTGEALAQGKFRLSEGRAEGSLSIPTAALTGNYYLKSYTRWMRNAGPENFSYTPLKIINPYRKEVLGPAHLENMPAGKQKLSYTEGILECSISSQSFTGGQEVSLQVEANATVFPGQLGYSVTVVPEGSIDLIAGQYENNPPSENDSFRVNFLPDLGEGVSISGTVVDPEGEPVPFTTLHFSMLGEVRDYYATMSDNHGRFIIATPTGIEDVQEFYVTPGQEGESPLEVRIDQEYDSRELSFPQTPFQLSAEEMEIARKIALNIQLENAYRRGEPRDGSNGPELIPDARNIPFYGTGVQHLLIDDYVRLPNLEEIFINLVPQVQFYREKGKKKIKILSVNSSIDVYKPLVMIDNISVFDHEAVLALSPEKIERIDLIDDVYLKGNVTFGGILAIYSTKGDMAGIDLPQGSYFFDYQSFHPTAPLPEVPSHPEDRVPDSRNTFFWSGNMMLEQGKKMEFSFQAPWTSGNYIVLLRGVLPDGQLHSTTVKFSVE